MGKEIISKVLTVPALKEQTIGCKMQHLERALEIHAFLFVILLYANVCAPAIPTALTLYLHPYPTLTF